MREDRRQKLAARFAFGFVRIATDTHPRLDEWTNQPRPDRSLVIGAVALAHTSSVMRCVARFAPRERTQAYGHPKPRLNRGDNPQSLFVFKQRIRQAAHCKDLIGAEGCIDNARFVVAVYHIIEAAAGVVPKPAAERSQPAFKCLCPA